MDPLNIFRSFTAQGLMELVKTYEPEDPSASFTSQNLQDIFTGRSKWRSEGPRKFHPKAEPHNQKHYQTKNPDVAISYTWGLDLRRQLPVFFEQLFERFREINFIFSRAEFDRLTFWLDIFFVDQNSKNLALDLNEAQRTYRDARMHVFFLFRDPLSRGWILFEIGVRAWAVKSEFHLDDQELVSIVSGTQDPLKKYNSRNDWEYYNVSHILNRAFTQFIVCDKITDIDKDLSKYSSYDTFTNMITSQVQDKPMIQTRIEQLLGTRAHFNLIIQAFAKRELQKLGRKFVSLCLEPVVFTNFLMSLAWQDAPHEIVVPLTAEKPALGSKQDTALIASCWGKMPIIRLLTSRPTVDKLPPAELRPALPAAKPLPAPPLPPPPPKPVLDLMAPLPPLHEDDSDLYTPSERLLYEHVWERGGRFQDVRDLAALLQHDKFDAREVAPDMHEKKFRRAAKPTEVLAPWHCAALTLRRLPLDFFLNTSCVGRRRILRAKPAYSWRSWPSRRSDTRRRVSPAGATIPFLATPLLVCSCALANSPLGMGSRPVFSCSHTASTMRTRNIPCT